MEIPHKIVALLPIEHPFLTLVGKHVQSLAVCRLPSGLTARGYRSLVNMTPCPMKTESSTVTPEHRKEWLEILQFSPTRTPLWISTNGPIRVPVSIWHP